MKIEKVVTGCKCTLADYDRSELGPGDSMLVGLSWNIGRQVGFTSQFPRVHHNAPETPTYITLKALAIPAADSARPVSVSPYKAELSVAAEVRFDSVALNFRNHLDKTLALQVVSFPLKECQMMMPDSLPVGSDAVGVIKVKPEFADVEFVGSVTLQFSDEKNSRLTVPIRRKIYTK